MKSLKNTYKTINLILFKVKSILKIRNYYNATWTLTLHVPLSFIFTFNINA
jgi:hypothetical protein